MPVLPQLPARPVSALALALAVTAIGTPALAAPATAPAAPLATASAPRPATVTVTGMGAASAAPDLAVVSAGVEVTKPTAKQALAAQSSAADALLTAVRKAGVAERDVRTESLALSAVYQEANGQSKLTGYQAAQSFSIKVRDLARTGAVLQSAMDATGDAGRISSITFDLAHPEKLRSAAREAAHDDAHEKARQYARLTGKKLGPLVSLDETDGGRPRPVPVPAIAFDKESVPVAPGEIEDQVTVTAVYELR
ncbi:SIMPL domain-containing protein [Streptomyces sp. NPDC059009]|uniref:SIMPL domain-containing protein n=1 Tax=Streptomyces sp. NPDC059009 TaxID=3346694 RepID=UPI0036A16937